MASTYSPLKIELIGTGEQAGTWGTTTNTNLGTALEEAITGRATATFPSDANFTLTYTDSNSAQVFRNLVLNVTSSGNLSATRDLIIPAIEKQYFVENNTSGGQSIRVKTAAGNGVTIPNGRVANVFCDGTNTRFASDLIGNITTGNITAGNVTATGDVSITGSVTSVLKIANGTVSAPSLAASADTNTGIYFPAADELAVAAGGYEMIRVDNTGSSTRFVDFRCNLRTEPDVEATIESGRFSSIDGGSTLTTIGGSTFFRIEVEDSPKMYIMDTGRVGIGTGIPNAMLHVATVSNETSVLVDNGTATTFLVTYASGETALVGNPASGQLMAVGTTNDRSLRFVTNSAERLRISNTGTVGINVSSNPVDKLTVIGDSTGSGSSTVNFRNSGNTELLRIRDDGVFFTGGASLSPYNNTTGAAANVHVGASGDLLRSTSSIRYKKDVTDYDKGLNAVMALRPVYYKDNRTDENRVAGDQTYAGLIAEEVHAAGLGEFVQYNPKNEPDALAYGNMVALLTKAIQELKAELDAVKAELAAMKGN
jgi:hypothetical protein